MDFSEDGLGKPKFSHKSLYPKKSDPVGTMRGEYKDWYDENGKVINYHHQNIPFESNDYNKCKSIFKNILGSLKSLFKK